MGVLRVIGDSLRVGVDAQSLERVHQLDDLMRTALPLARRVVVLSPDRDSGCSFVAGHLCTVLAARRQGRVLAVNASGRRESLLAFAGVTTDARLDGNTQRRRAGARSAQEATDPLVRAPSGPYALDLGCDTTSPSSESTWLESVQPAGRFFDVTVTGLGVWKPLEHAAVLDAQHVALIVTSATRDGLQRALDLGLHLQPRGVTPHVAVVDSTAGANTALPAILKQSPFPASYVPFLRRADRNQTPAAYASLPLKGRLAMLELAAGIVEACGGAR